MEMLEAATLSSRRQAKKDKSDKLKGGRPTKSKIKKKSRDSR